MRTFTFTRRNNTIRPLTTAWSDPNTTPATDKQTGYITALAISRSQDGTVPPLDGITKAQAKRVIDALLLIPVLRRVNDDLTPGTAITIPAQPVTDIGMYRQNGRIYKVQESKTSGNLYAKVLTQIGGERLTLDGETANWTFEYAAGAIKSLSAADRLTLTEAKAFGLQYGVCCVCGKTLTDAKSVEAGIGPVCSKRV